MNIIDYENTIFVHHHLGLGDHVVCNGMVRFILKKYNPNKLILIVKNKNLESVKNMYRDCKTIDFLCVDTDSDFYKLNLNWNNIKLIRSGFEKCREIDWAESLYDSVNISFQERWDSFYYERDTNKELQLISKLNIPDDFILVHDVSSVGAFNLKLKSNLPVIKVIPVEGFDIFSWLKIVENAKEVHCIDSSFAHIVESFKDINLNLYFHEVKNNGVKFPKKQKWNIICYDK